MIAAKLSYYFMYISHKIY